MKASAAAFCEGDTAEFDSFADPAGLIMQHIIEEHCKEAPNFRALLAHAKELHLPNNPLVSAPAAASVAMPSHARCAICCRLLEKRCKW